MNDIISEITNDLRSVGLYLIDLADQKDTDLNNNASAIPLPVGINEGHNYHDYTRLSRLANDEYIRRRNRNRFLPQELFGEPAWDILIDLFVAEISQMKISISSACIASAVPNTTALRWVKQLEEMSLVEKIPDPKDKRRQWIKLSKYGYDKCKMYFEWVSKSEISKVYKYGS